MAVVTAVLSISLKCAALMQFPLPAQNALRLNQDDEMCVAWIYDTDLKAAARSSLKRLREAFDPSPFLALYLPYSSRPELT